MFSDATNAQIIILVGVVTTALLQLINAAGHWWGTRPVLKAVQEKTEVVNKKLDGTDLQLKHIEKLTNSSYTDLENKLKTALERIDKLEGQLAEAVKKLSNGIK